MSKHSRIVSCALGVMITVVGAACSDGTTPLAPSSGASALSGPVGNGPGSSQHADVSNQGGAGVYAPNGAKLVRQPSGLRASISMPTPLPGTYNYPAGRTPGHPEVFTLWAFVFNRPELCSAPCNADDLGATPARGGVYNVGGHFASGNQLTITGRIAVGEAAFGGSPLEAPQTAEVHLAVAPHGAVDPARLPDEFRLPTGPMTFWWIAVFH